MNSRTFRMMNFTRLTQRLLVLSLLWAADTLPLSAQSAASAASLKFSCAVWEPLPISPIYYRDGKSYLSLEFSPGSRSKLYPLKVGNALELYKKVTAEDGEITYQLVGKAPWIAGARRMLFLVDPVANASRLPLKLFGVNDALDVFPPGTFRFFNFSNTTLEVKFGGQVSQLTKGESTVVKSNVSDQGGLLPILMADTNNRIIFENRLFAQPDFREMVFIGNPATPNGTPKVKFLTQVIPPEPAEPAGPQPSSSP
jgi:hypothetical protein